MKSYSMDLRQCVLDDAVGVATAAVMVNPKRSLNSAIFHRDGKPFISILGNNR
jgi:hypothetical protein